NQPACFRAHVWRRQRYARVLMALIPVAFPVAADAIMQAPPTSLSSSGARERRANLTEQALRLLYLDRGRSLALPGVCLLGGLLFLVVAWFFWRAESRIVPTGVAATARVTDKGRRSESQRDANGDIQFAYWLRYVYRDGDGREHETRVTLPMLA